MIYKILQIILILLIKIPVFGQVIIIPTIGGSMPEHGFLPGKQFPFYPTIDKYEFKNKRLRVELYDDRNKLKLNKVQCSSVEFTNTSEFANSDCIYKVGQYFDSLFNQNGGIIDSTSNDTLKVSFKGIDARLIGLGYIKVHGLCEMKFNYHNFTKTYCIDIVDGDKHSPLGKTAFVTRKTATRYLASAAIREVIEQFFVDFRALN